MQKTKNQIASRSLNWINQQLTHSDNWFDKDLQVLMYEKEKLFKKYVNKKTLTAKVKYNKATKSLLSYNSTEKEIALFISF